METSPTNLVSSVIAWVQVWAQFITGNPAGGLDVENSLCWDPLVLNPLLDGLPRYFEFVS